VPFDFDSEKLSAVGVAIAIVAAGAAVEWNRPPVLGGEPEAGNMASTIDLTVCGELVMIREGDDVPQKMVV